MPKTTKQPTADEILEYFQEWEIDAQIEFKKAIDQLLQEKKKLHQDSLAKLNVIEK